MSEESSITPVQQEVLHKALEMLREHFDYFVFACDTEAPEGTDRLFQCIQHGGITMAVGLCERSKLIMTRPKEEE